MRRDDNPAEGAPGVVLPSELASDKVWAYLGERHLNNSERWQITYMVRLYEGAHGPIVVLDSSDSKSKLPLSWISARRATLLHRDLAHPELVVFEKSRRDGQEQWAALPYVEDEFGDWGCVRVTDGALEMLDRALRGCTAAEVRTDVALPKAVPQVAREL